MFGVLIHGIISDIRSDTEYYFPGIATSPDDLLFTQLIPGTQKLLL